MTNLSHSTETSHNADFFNNYRSRGDRPYTIYLAGDLWTHKDLIGNALLAEYIKSVSHGRYQCVLPQDLEEPVNRSVDIRNVDLKHVMMCDMAIFNFDGSNLDAGTVVEFIYAKMIDIPSVILRTDFRSAGEGNQEQDPWNLMATHWPRTKVVKLHGMVEYQGAKTPGQLGKTIENLYEKMAAAIIESLDAVRQEKPLVSDPARMAAMYQWAIDCPGAGYDTLFGNGEVDSLLSEKKQKGLLAK
jgi:nucleoside 2-deoxyribosyltransferase